MRIVHVDTEKGFRGGENQVLLLMQGLRGLGVEQCLLAREGEELARRAAAEGFEVHTVARPVSWLPGAKKRLRELALGNAPSIVHAHTGNAHSLAAAAAAGRAPILVTRRVDFPLKSNPWTRRKYTEPGTWFVAISRAIADVLERGGVDASRIVLIHSGVKTDRFVGSTGRDRVREEWGVSPDRTLVGMVGSWVDHKDPLNLVEAAFQCTRVAESPTADSLRFALVGDGPLRPHLEGAVAGFKLQERVTLAGWRNDVGDCLAAFDLFVMPSKLEGLCTSLIDAQAVGLPCIATRAGGMPDVVTHGENGLLIEPRDPKALAAAILRLAADPELQRRFRENGPRIAEERFSAERMVERYVETYRQTLEEWKRLRER